MPIRLAAFSRYIPPLQYAMVEAWEGPVYGCASWLVRLPAADAREGSAMSNQYDLPKDNFDCAPSLLYTLSHYSDESRTGSGPGASVALYYRVGWDSNPGCRADSRRLLKSGD